MQLNWDFSNSSWETNKEKNQNNPNTSQIFQNFQSILSLVWSWHIHIEDFFNSSWETDLEKKWKYFKYSPDLFWNFQLI